MATKLFHASVGGRPGVATQRFEDLGLSELVAATLFVLAAILVLWGRRRRENLLLAAFLALVALNFGAVGLAWPWGEGSRELLVVAQVALAFDPLLLLLFVTRYPYVRRTRPARVLIGVTGALGLVGATVALLDPAAGVRQYEGPVLEAWGHLLVVAELILAYSAAWVLSVRAAVEAPTPLLRTRAAWLVVAVGVASVPRLANLADDLGLQPRDLAARMMVSALLATLGFSLGLLAARAGRPLPDGLRRAFVAVGAATLAMLAGVLLMRAVEDHGWLPPGEYNLYTLRWVAFAGIFVYGMLSHEIVESRVLTRGLVPTTVGALVGLAVFVVVGPTLAWSGEAARASFLTGLAAGTLSGVGAAAGALALASRLDPPVQGEARRLELYRAALEAAWASGPPGARARRQLEADRRAFGVSPEEARVLEHVVSAGLQKEGLAPGDEPVAGLVLGPLLGEGAHGRVFEARLYPEGKPVVVKELFPDAVGGAERRRHLLAEVRALSLLHTPRVVRLLDVHATRGRHLLVMERVEATPLSRLLAGKPLPQEAASRILLDLLEALAAAHEAGVVHRDVKPSNVLVDADGRAHLTDFGIATAPTDPSTLRSTVSAFTEFGAHAGTLAYMAPEQALGEPASRASDVYAAGLLAYEMLVGRPALDLRGRRGFDAIERVARPTLDLTPLPPAWRLVLGRALARDPTARYASAAQMRAEVEALVGAPLVARR